MDPKKRARLLLPEADDLAHACVLHEFVVRRDACETRRENRELYALRDRNVRPWFVNDQQQHDLLVQHLLAYRKSGVETLPCEGCPRHVPDAISAVPAVPYTLTGKKLEVPVRRVLSGMRPEQVASRDVLADPTALDY